MSGYFMRDTIGRHRKSKQSTSAGVLGALLALAIVGQAHAGPIVNTSDFINDGTRSHFNGFENIPNDGTFYTGGSGPYTEDTIQVQQINGNPGNSIWIDNSSWSGFEGSHAWYPNGGDHGYTSISLTGGINFQDVGFNYGSGGGTPTTILYQLLEGGVTVLSGSAPLTACDGCTSPINYLGFSGGGFDTIQIRDTLTGGTSVTDGSFQALQIDSIETQQGSAATSVPEPTTLALFGAGLAGLGALRRRRKAKA